jgi:hypothetical protein
MRDSLVDNAPGAVDEFAPGTVAQLGKDKGQCLPLVVILKDPSPAFDPGFVFEQGGLFDDFN